MLPKQIIHILLAVFLVKLGMAQNCTSIGQNPINAFPVCGTAVYNQGSVPICTYLNRNTPSCFDNAYNYVNPFWYKFTCYQSGTLGFVINPNDPNDDYNWQLYDITGHIPEEVFTIGALSYSGNWSGTPGPTGTSASGVNYIQCISLPSANAPTFAQMPQLVAGHNYILMVSHALDIQSGYTLTFSGGTANIVDPRLPHIDTSQSLCGGLKASLFLRKKLMCSSLSANGSEFTISPPLANVVAASGAGCSKFFDFGEITIYFDHPLPPGTYTVFIQNGTDGNTILDNCGNNIQVGESVPLVVDPILPTPMDSITPPVCNTDELQLVFGTGIRCTSISPDGSDFLVTGSTPEVVRGARGVCQDSTSKVIYVYVSPPLQTKGTYQIKLAKGNDGNTIIDNCFQETPAGATLNFYTKDTVNADFTYKINYGCKQDTINYFHDGRNDVNSWKWNFDNQFSSILQNPSVIYTTFQQKHAQLTVSNGACSATSALVLIPLENAMKAGFEATSLVCPGEFAYFNDNSTGRIVSWLWDFGNGSTSTLQAPPPQFYTPPRVTASITARLTVKNFIGCSGTAVQKITVPNNCNIAVPGAFTPNNDGLNDYLYPLNAWKAKDLLFNVYNRYGQLVFTTRDWNQKWDGRFKGQVADPGTYVWILHYINSDTGKYVDQKGTTILIR